MILTKKAKIITFLTIALGLLTVGFFAGYNYCKSSNYRGVIKQQKEDAEDVLKHTEKTQVVKKNVDEKIQVIKKIVDPSGCLDGDSPDDYLNGLLNADSEAKSGFN